MWDLAMLQRLNVQFGARLHEQNRRLKQELQEIIQQKELDFDAPTRPKTAEVRQ